MAIREGIGKVGREEKGVKMEEKKEKEWERRKHPGNKFMVTALPATARAIQLVSWFSRNLGKKCER